MKISKADVERIAEAIRPLDTPAMRDQYRTGNYARSESTKDVDKRYRWDLFHAACGWRVSCDLYDKGCNDVHIDTALRSIVPVLATRAEVSTKQAACEKCTAVPSYHADLHAGHDWTNVQCPAYQSRNGDDCTCGGNPDHFPSSPNYEKG